MLRWKLVKSKLVLFVGAMFLLVLLVIYPVQAEGIVISIPDQVLVSGPRILLGDIAQIKGVTGTGLESIGKLDLGKSPLPGYSRHLNRELIRLLLQQEGLQPGEIKLDVSRTFTVKTRSKEINSDQLLEFAKKYVKSRAAREEDKVKISFNFYPEKVIIPDTEYRLEVANNRNDRNLRGRISLPVIIKTNGERWKQIYIGMEISVNRKVYVARKDIERGGVLKKEDFELMERELNNFRGELITVWEHPLIEEGVVDRPIKQGDILTTAYLKKPFLISWGEKIRAEVIVGGVRVRTAVKACNRGKKGDYITVENLKSGERFKARVISSHLVRITR